MRFTVQIGITDDDGQAIVHEDIAEAFVARVVELSRQVRFGDPMDATTQVGAIVTPAHRAVIDGYVKAAAAEGAEIKLGGEIMRADETVGSNGKGGGAGGLSMVLSAALQSKPNARGAVRRAAGVRRLRRVFGGQPCGAPLNPAAGPATARASRRRPRRAARR